jgi:hypothetical protein
METDFATLTHILNDLGFTLDPNQIHIKGERAVISTNKLVLLGHHAHDNKRVVIKASNNPDGIAEIRREQTCRELLPQIKFAYQTFASPSELLYIERQGYLIMVTEFIEQDLPFLDRSFEEQFDLSLRAFKAQESAHATTRSHGKEVRNSYGFMSTHDYINAVQTYRNDVSKLAPNYTHLYDMAIEKLNANISVIELYQNFLTHSDFVPHNIRVKDGVLYLLDHSSIRFGNKYDGWARFLNFMVLYNRDLERALIQYVSDNRTPEEMQSLCLMRIYRYSELTWYYAKQLEKTKGALNQLSQARIAFWAEALSLALENKDVPESRVEEYRVVRDSLRSQEEKDRQIGLH